MLIHMILCCQCVMPHDSLTSSMSIPGKVINALKDLLINQNKLSEETEKTKASQKHSPPDTSTHSWKEMTGKKPYMAVTLVQPIYAGMFLLLKALFDGGLNNFVFVFYRQTAATVFLVPLALYFEW